MDTLPTEPFEYFEWFVESFSMRGYRAQRNKRGDVHVQCPGHNDRGPSLHLTLKGNAILMECFGACGPNANKKFILSQVGLEPKHLFVPDPTFKAIPGKLGTPPAALSAPASDQPRSAFSVLDDDELYPGVDDEETEVIPYHWDGFVAEGDVVTVLGAKKAMKTWVVDYVAVSAAHHQPLFDGLPHGNQRVLIIVGPGENKGRETRRRIRAIRRQHGITSSKGAIKVITYTTAALRLDRNDAELYGQLLEVAKGFQANMLVLETTGALWGGKNENDTPEVREWLTERLVPLIQACAPRCTTYLQAHTGKPTRWQNKVLKRRDQRGASGWAEAVDTTLVVDSVDAPEGEAISLVDQDFTRTGESTKRVIRVHLTGGPRSGKPVEMTLSWHEHEQDAPSSGSTVAIQAAAAAAKELYKAGTGGIYKQALLDALTAEVNGKPLHTANAARNAVEVVRGKEAWPYGPYWTKEVSIVNEEQVGGRKAVHLVYNGPADLKELEPPPF
jgi:hypothetical protein